MWLNVSIFIIPDTSHASGVVLNGKRVTASPVGFSSVEIPTVLTSKLPLPMNGTQKIPENVALGT